MRHWERQECLSMRTGLPGSMHAVEEWLGFGLFRQHSRPVIQLFTGVGMAPLKQNSAGLHGRFEMCDAYRDQLLCNADD